MTLFARSKTSRLSFAQAFCVLGLLAIFLLLVVGVARAFGRGANDFSVFYGAWRLILEGRAQEIYRVSTDRFLYAPAFAWILAPLGLLPRNAALSVWCLMKVCTVLLLIKKLSISTNQVNRWIVWGLTGWGIVMLARPFLIDFEYGQVNLFIVGACIWALQGHFEKTSSAFWDGLRWMVLTFFAVAKLYPIPLLLVPWTLFRGVSHQKIKHERFAVIAGVILILLIPFLGVGWSGAIQLFGDWREALLARGLPLETHNQSFTALLHHYLSGVPTPIHSRGGGPLFFGQPILSLEQIALFSIAWTLISMGCTLGWILSGETQVGVRRWSAVAIALMIVPSHLLWKPYFVMSIPMSVLVIQDYFREPHLIRLLLILGVFSGINLTGFDFVGHLWAAHFEAASLLLLMHLALIAMVLFQKPLKPVPI